MNDYNNMILALEEKQVEDIALLKDLLLEIIECYLSDNKMSDPNVFEIVLSKCDEIDYQDLDTVMAYAMLHLLDRYRRFQFMQIKLIESGYLKNSPHLSKKRHYHSDKEEFQTRILDVGTGPAPALLAYSDFFDWYSDFKNITIDIKMDYIEQSMGFRSFLHYLVEFAMVKNKFYHVPFHKGTFYNVLDYSESSYRLGKSFKSRKYDFVIFSNFLTNDDFVENIKPNLHEIFNSLTNKSIVLIVGAKPTSKKYSKIYNTLENIIGKRFSRKQYKGQWKKIFSESFDLKYSDHRTGEVVRSYFNELKHLLNEKGLLTKLPDSVIKLIERGSGYNSKSSWYVEVYQKFSYIKYYKKNR
ncbi:MAG: hypothetical protein GX328_03930 [Clostridiaceae bacterium]|nr:hypothetical protein [Clostridiaceae bacterium]